MKFVCSIFLDDETGDLVAFDSSGLELRDPLCIDQSELNDERIWRALIHDGVI